RLRMSVTLETRQGGEREIWFANLDGGESDRETRVRLRGKPGDIVRLGLYVGDTASGRFAWALWMQPRIVGRGRAFSLEPRPYSAQEDGRAARLRQDLREACVMLVFLDAVQTKHMGCHGYKRNTTPEIDRIAADGILFERAYTPAVYTLGAISSVWTSQYPDQHHGGVTFLDGLPENWKTLAELLTERGVRNVGVVANAMAGAAKRLERGFEEFQEIYGDPELGSRAEVFRASLHPWLRRHHDERFFAYAHFREPHFPYDPPPPFNSLFGPDAPLTHAQRSQRSWYTSVNQGHVRPQAAELEHLLRLYDGNLAYADREVGELRKALESAGLWDRCVLIVTADHGEQFYEHGYIGHSAQVYQESTHIPLIVRLPKGVGPRGVRIRELVDLLDLAPTITDVFGLNGDDGMPFDPQGRSLLPVIAGAPGKPATLARTVWNRPVYGLTDGRFKLIHDTRSGEEELYDIEGDRDERNDLSDHEPIVAMYFRQELYSWLAKLNAGPRERGGPEVMTCAQCENLKALGYLREDTPCPCPE
ncbi:MAG: sulfatase, partial [Vicinamibacteria bacterium]|nr:sulfatase [Vicinamibacteria bacterium]